MGRIVKLLGWGGQVFAEKTLGWNGCTIRKGQQEHSRGKSFEDLFTLRGRRRIEEKYSGPHKRDRG
ncbi:MAG: hypothetical protein Q9M28_08175 [Mariprofundaceae bacterium]|nr:hypothetical protein [Mariprofundaceae bacterium]